MGVPKTTTPYFLKIPYSSNSHPKFKAVYPPKPKKTPSGRSFLIIASKDSTFKGDK